MHWTGDGKSAFRDLVEDIVLAVSDSIIRYFGIVYGKEPRSIQSHFGDHGLGTCGKVAIEHEPSHIRDSTGTENTLEFVQIIDSRIRWQMGENRMRERKIK